MDKERRVVHIDLKDCSPEEVAFRLKKHTDIDIDDIPVKYGTSLIDTQKFTGLMAPRILKNASGVVCFVCTLAGFNDLRNSSDDIMEDYQKPLFRLLQPDDIGCILDKHMRMIPFKSTSAIIGLVDEALPETEDLIPCAFCNLHKTCPASKV